MAGTRATPPAPAFIWLNSCPLPCHRRHSSTPPDSVRSLVSPRKGWQVRPDMQLGMGWTDLEPQALACAACLGIWFGFGCLASCYRGAN